MAEFLHYYWYSIREVTVQFLDLFSNVQVVRKAIKRENGTKKVYEASRFKVPLLFSPMSRRAYDIMEELVINNKRATFPIMTFFISGINVDNERMTFRVPYGSEIGYTFAPLPIKLNYSVTIWTDLMDDKLQILEQIIPLFNFHRIILTKAPEPWGGTDVFNWVFLDGINSSDSDGYSQDDRRVFKTDLDFVIETALFREYIGENQEPLIKEIDVNFKDMERRIETLRIIGDETTGEIIEVIE